VKFPFEAITDFIFVPENVSKPADIILIPGGSHAQLMERAAQLYKQGLAPLILPSGHYNHRIPEYSSEGEYLKEVGVRLGVPKEAILKEERASHTFENAKFSLEIIRKEGLQVKKAILVCKAFHSRRALLTYKTVFPQDTIFFTSPVVGKSGINRENWFQTEESIEMVMGEVVKIGQYFKKHVLAWSGGQ